ncbi:hypothetical protein ACM39_04755 [Chryseobacterium sp. FH2]|uniref:hypothetical protein n=1 Tax=Chryseobacterium sp. FH2 TaxID=1674291 RepID=UPI00065B052A|nr:hypothetical protein [Chryseobacterium sp. FH2]KMQ69395.1 hypothetical protein ACM39_04755 [Chryseobacterium sp. FH2]
MKKINTEKQFPTMESEINKLTTNFGASLAWFAVLCLSFLAIMPFLEFYEYGFLNYLTNKATQFWGLIVMEITSLGGSIFLANYLLTARKKNLLKIIVNDKGAFIFTPENKIFRQFLYSELCKSNGYEPDISVYINYKPVTTTVLKIHRKNSSGEIIQEIMSFHWEYYALKNRFALYQHFLKGIQIFRPDLKIQQYALNTFHLNPD